MSPVPLGVSAVWLGVLTALSPCPLATNVAAICFLGRRAGDARAVLAAGLMYALGRSAAYVALAALLVWGLLSPPGVGPLLDRYVHRFLGPLLILAGLVLLQWLTFGGFGTGVSQGLQARSARWGLCGAALLGGAFALTFCPVTAALFFGSLVPLALRCDSPVALPLLYGLGTGAPVIAFALLIAGGARSLGAVFDRLVWAEGWARRATGALFLLIGIYLSLRYVYGLTI
jgi:cytochrome c biogenesis protein CcdA